METIPATGSINEIIAILSASILIVAATVIAVIKKGKGHKKSEVKCLFPL